MNYVERLVIDDQEYNKDSDIYKEHFERYKFSLQFITDKKVLDIACGSGYGSYLIAQSGAQEVWGGDIEQQAIETAKQNYQEENLHFRVIDVLDIPFDDSYFDVVVSFETIEHVRDVRVFRDELFRVLKPGGKLILSTPNRKVTQRLGIHNPYHLKEFSVEELVGLFGPVSPRASRGRAFRKIKVLGQRPVKKMSLKQRLLQQAYFIYRQLGALRFLGKLMSDKARKDIGKEIEGLEKDFKIKEIKQAQEYLYLILIADK